MPAAPTIAPTSWAATYPGTSRQGELARDGQRQGDRRVDVAAGDVPIAYTAPTMTSMNANEIIPSWAIEKGTFVPAVITPVAAAEPGLDEHEERGAESLGESFVWWWVELPCGSPSAAGRGVSPPSARWDRARNAFEHRRTVFHET